MGSSFAFIEFEVGDFVGKLDAASQTLVSLCSRRDVNFDYLPFEFCSRRRYDGAHNIGDVTLRYRVKNTSTWTSLDTASKREDVRALKHDRQTVISAADITATLGQTDGLLKVEREWLDLGNMFGMRINITNTGHDPVEIGSLGLPIQISNILTDLSEVEAQRKCSFADPYIGLDAGYVQVTPIRGTGSALVILPHDNSPFEAWRFLTEPEGGINYGGQTFEGSYEWQIHSKAWAENEWMKAEPWHQPTSKTLDPDETYSVGFRFTLANTIPEVGDAVVDAGVPFAECVPGYIIPKDTEATLVLRHSSPVASIDTNGAFTSNEVSNNTYRLAATGSAWGRTLMTISYEDGKRQSIHYFITKSAPQVMSDLGSFFTSKAHYTDATDPFGRAPSIMTYDREVDAILLQDPRVWVAGLSDEGGSGAYVASILKQLIQPSQTEVTILDAFVHETLWGSIQKNGEHAVASSVFFYDPPETPFAYDSSIDYSGLASWNKPRCDSGWRSYNYIWPTTAYWVFYRLARDYPELQLRGKWDWYLSQAYKTIIYCFEDRERVQYADGGLMGETSVRELLTDLRRENWMEQHDNLQREMKKRMDLWAEQDVPFGSEMPWDSTGQEAVYAWSRHFGIDEKRQQSIQTIVGFMPSVAHWGWNGNARRYWDFLNGGKIKRFERQIHHYGSGLNAIPLLTEFECDPSRHHLLKIGYAGISAPLSNIDQEGFASCGFHSWPETLKWDPLSGDYLGIVGLALAQAVYVVERNDTVIVYGGQVVHESSETVQVEPRDAVRKRVFIAALGLKIELSAGAMRSVTYSKNGGAVTLEVDSCAQVQGKNTAHQASETIVWLSEPASKTDQMSWAVTGVGRKVREGFMVSFSTGKTTTIDLSRSGA